MKIRPVQKIIDILRGKYKQTQTIYGDIVVIDSVLPHPMPIDPRNSDAVEFSKILPNFKYYTMYPMKPGKLAWFSHGYGKDAQIFQQDLKKYLTLYPTMEGKIEYLNKHNKYHFNLAYTYFLAETYTLLPFLEQNKIPFIFLLNAGGAFGFNNLSSDKMIKAICSSKYFQGVIVNQYKMGEYIKTKKLCKAEKVIYDPSGSVQFKPKDVVKKKYYKKDKKNFDVCFVASKYSDKGLDKGYDLFIETAKMLASQYPDMRFHVVGGFSADDIDVSTIQKQIKFYGYLKPEELPIFYSQMDIYLSPNRKEILYKGHSDGFPLSAGAMYCGVCGFNSDEYGLNHEFIDDYDVVIIKPQVKDIANKIEYYIKHLDKLYEISKQGQLKAMKLYDIDAHIKSRVDLFKKIKDKMK